MTQDERREKILQYIRLKFGCSKEIAEEVCDFSLALFPQQEYMSQEDLEKFIDSKMGDMFPADRDWIPHKLAEDIYTKFFSHAEKPQADACLSNTPLQKCSICEKEQPLVIQANVCLGCLKKKQSYNPLKPSAGKIEKLKNVKESYTEAIYLMKSKINELIDRFSQNEA